MHCHLLVIRACVMVRLVSRGSHFMILRNMQRMWKHVVMMALTWDFMVSRISPRFLVWLVGVCPNSAGHQVEFPSYVFFQKVRTSVLPVFSL